MHEWQADPETDAAVAERVFSATGFRRDSRGTMHRLAGRWERVRPYSSEMESAWLLFLHLCATWPHTVLQHDDDHRWHCVLWTNLDDPRPMISASADTAPLAIVRAALAAAQETA